MARGAGGPDEGLHGAVAELATSFPADRVARSLAEEQVHTRLTESLFVFPPWLTVGVPLFVGALTMLAEFYPARRAARVNPVARLDRPRVQDDGPDNLPQR